MEKHLLALLNITIENPLTYLLGEYCIQLLLLDETVVLLQLPEDFFTKYVQCLHLNFHEHSLTPLCGSQPVLQPSAELQLLLGGAGRGAARGELNLQRAIEC